MNTLRSGFWKMCFQGGALVFLAGMGMLGSCKKETVDSEAHSSIKLISTTSVPKKVNMVASTYGNLLAYFASEAQGDAAFPQELYLLNQAGEVKKEIFLADTVYQYMSAVRALNGGFMVCASDNGSAYFSLYHIGDNGEVLWSRNVPLAVGTILNAPLIATYNNDYMVIYQSYSWGYYMWKGDANGMDILNKRIPIPNARHYGSGLNYGEKYSRFIQGNDSLIVIQGITYDEYDEMIENCFIRTVDENVNRRWYSGNYDSTHIESSSGLFYSHEDKIVLFGSRSAEAILEGYGDGFARTYSLAGILESEVIYPRVGGTLNTFKQTIRAPDGGYLMVGSNNQLPSNIVVSPTQLVFVKLNPDLSVDWSNTLNTNVASKGFDAVYLSDGSIGVAGLLKDNNRTNKIIYLHLSAQGRLIAN